MAKKNRTGKACPAVALAALTMLWAAGCSSSPVASNQPHDPLHGVLEPPTMPKPSHAPKTPGTPASFSNNNSFNNPGFNNTGPIGTDLTSTNNATLAGMNGPLGRPLAIDDQGRPSKTQQTPVSPGYIPPNSKPRVEAVPDAHTSKVTPSSWQTPAQSNKIETPNNWQGPAPASAVATPSAAEIVTQLKERGVFNQKVEQVPDGIKLTCYASGGLSGGVRIIDATAADYPSAAQAIMRQLEAVR